MVRGRRVWPLGEKNKMKEQGEKSGKEKWIKFYQKRGG